MKYLIALVVIVIVAIVTMTSEPKKAQCDISPDASVVCQLVSMDTDIGNSFTSEEAAEAYLNQ